jgi:hypothetical protein
MHQPCVDNIVSAASILPNHLIKCALALWYNGLERIQNDQTLQRHLAAARKLDNPNGCREQYVHNNTSLV